VLVVNNKPVCNGKMALIVTTFKRLLDFLGLNTKFLKQ
jgi:hypothetical protein